MKKFLIIVIIVAAIGAILCLVLSITYGENIYNNLFSISLFIISMSSALLKIKKHNKQKHLKWFERIEKGENKDDDTNGWGN